MNVLVICDVPNWAIGKLANVYIKGNPHFNFRELYVHPKEVSPSAIQSVSEAAEWADVIIMEYWNTARQLIEALPKLREKKLVLMHHNQKDLLSADWSMFNMILCHTKKAEAILKGAGYKNVVVVPYGLDFNYWKYRETMPTGEPFKIGYAGRIVPWKNLRQVAQASWELDTDLLFMGKMDKLAYWESIPIEQRDAIDMSFMNCKDDERLEFYHTLDAFINFCSDGREEGTMPLLEAMAAGIPVITTLAGTAADIIEDGVNGLIVPFDDYDALKAAIVRLRDDKELRQALRSKGWETIRNFTEPRMAWRYEDVIYRVFRDEPLVSIIIPAHLADEGLQKLIERCGSMTWLNTEVVLCADGDFEKMRLLVSEFQKNHPRPIKYLETTGVGYGLAEARNRGVIASHGDYLMFCDSRLMPEKDAINRFMDVIFPYKKAWLFGDKGAGKKNFVENFSFIRRSDLIAAGMFNERIDRYGGMSQELRERFMRQGFQTGFVPEARAEQIKTSRMTPQRRDDIVAMKDLLWKLGLNKN